MCNTCQCNPCQPWCDYHNLSPQEKQLISNIEATLNLPTYLTMDEGGMIHLCIGDCYQTIPNFPFPQS